MFFLPNGILHKSTHNPNARDSQNYSIIEDLAQVPCTKSTLEVLQSYPMQRKALLLTIGGIDPSKSNIISFEMDHSEPRICHHLAFQIQVVGKGKNIFHMIIDEGIST